MIRRWNAVHPKSPCQAGESRRCPNGSRDRPAVLRLRQEGEARLLSVRRNRTPHGTPTGGPGPLPASICLQGHHPGVRSPRKMKLVAGEARVELVAFGSPVRRALAASTRSLVFLLVKSTIEGRVRSARISCAPWNGPVRSGVIIQQSRISRQCQPSGQHVDMSAQLSSDGICRSAGRSSKPQPA